MSIWPTSISMPSIHIKSKWQWLGLCPEGGRQFSAYLVFRFCFAKRVELSTAYRHVKNTTHIAGPLELSLVPLWPVRVLDIAD